MKPAETRGPSGQAPQNESARRRWWSHPEALLLFGLLCIYGAFWIGPFGYGDLSVYATDAETLWLGHHWDIPLPAGLEGGYHYSRFSIGLAVFSGPFVLLGQCVEWLSGGAIGRRWIMCLLPPLATAGGALLVRRIGLLHGQGGRASTIAAAIFGVSAASLYYARLFYLEPVCECLALGGFWAFFKAWPPVAATADSAAVGDGAGDPRWLLAAGFGIAGAVMCHYAEAPLLGVVGLVMAAVVFRRGGRRRWIRLAALAAAPMVIGLSIVAMNVHRYGGVLATGYDRYAEARLGWYGMGLLGNNLSCLAEVVAGTPWLVAVVAWGGYHLARPGRWDRGTWCIAAVVGGLIAQETLVWERFLDTRMFYLRYHAPMVGVAAAALPAVIAAADRHLGARGIAYGCSISVIAGAALFLGVSDMSRPFRYDPGDRFFPGQVTMTNWYGSRAAYVDHGDYTYRFPGDDEVISDIQAPLRPQDVVVLVLLVAVGTALVVRAVMVAPAAAAGIGTAGGGPPEPRKPPL